MQSCYLRTQHGFSLTELLIALVVLSIALLGLSRATVSMLTVHTANERSAHAAALLQDRMETLKHSGYSGAATVSSTENYGTIAQYSTYKRETNVVVNCPPANNMKTVEVIVSWQNGQYTLSTCTTPGQNGQHTLRASIILAE